MKKTIKKLWTILLTLVVTVVMASCSKDAGLYNPSDYIVEKKRVEYNESFQKSFGKVASTHDWGFNAVADVANARATSRGHDVNRNEWASKYNIPATVTHAEEKAIMNYLDNLTGWSNLKPQEKKTFVGTNRDAKPTFDWSQYFVWHVHKGTEIQDDHAGQNIGVVSNKMNHLQAVYANGTMEHINDFNHGANPAHGNSLEAATLMVNSTTYDFAYHNSIDNKYHNTYTVVDGSLIGYPGFYYICFDFFANGDVEQPANKNMGCSRNYNYTDWIVRICEAKPKDKYVARIICEDLGAIGDWDFNDVVFDAFIDKAANKTYIKLLAAGGTMRLSVANVEVHEAFGVDVKTMVNTGIVSKPAYEFVVDQAFDSYADIPIAIEDDKSASQLVVYTLKYSIGSAPQKICVGTDYTWCTEKQSIDDRYPLFKDYVGNPNLSYDWYRTDPE